MNHKSMSSYPRLALPIAVLLFATGLRAGTISLDGRWSIEAPEDWRYCDCQNKDSLRIYTLGVRSPEPLKDTLVMLVGSNMIGSTPLLIRGISMGIARKYVETVVVQGTQEITRKNGWLTKGYRQIVNTYDGKLILDVYVFPAKKLPGDPLPNSETRLVIVHIAGKTEDEVEQFTKLFEAIKAVTNKNIHAPGAPNHALEPTTPAVTHPADAGRAPAAVVAHL